MRVGDEDVGDALAIQRAFQRFDMRRNVGTGVDHDDIVLTKDIHASSFEGERTWIWSKQTSDPWSNRLTFAVGCIEIAIKWNWRWHAGLNRRRRFGASISGRH